MPSQSRFALQKLRLPLPRFIWRPPFLTAVAALHLLLAGSHLARFVMCAYALDLAKGLGALGGAYVFLALALHQVDFLDGRAASRPEVIVGRQGRPKRC
jgi:hypothetical protein